MVIYCVKRLGEVEEYTDHIMALLQGAYNTIHKRNNGHFGRVTLPESKLKLE